jgi:hypothetical protein
LFQCPAPATWRSPDRPVWKFSRHKREGW